MKRHFTPTYWGRLRQFELPHCVVHNGKLALKPNALAMLLILMQTARSARRSTPQPFIEVKITLKMLQERSGFSKNVITQSTKELEEKGFIKRTGDRRKRGEFGANVYLLCNPSNGQPLPAIATNFLLANGIPYIKLPKCIVRESSADWSIARMTSSELRLYIAICWLANRHTSNRFATSLTALKSLSGLSTQTTLQKAADGLVNKHLFSTSDDGEEMVVTLHDPYTGEPIHQQTEDPHDDPANYYVTDEKGREKRVNFNHAEPDEVEAIVRSLLEPEAALIPQKNGDFKICCPFHKETNPSCSVSPVKRCFYCFGCKAKGHLTQLLMQLGEISKAEAIQLITKSKHGVEFHDPDENAEAIYEYRDKQGKLLKQVLRYEEGKTKWFNQRRLFRGGWLWNIDGVKPTLYNLQLLEHAATVCICEGEKDCDNVMALSLKDSDGGDVIATTSGGADSWVDELAEELRGKRVVLLPHADSAGERYAEEIRASLDLRGIQHRTVSFDVKDVSDFLRAGHSVEELVQRIGTDWVMIPGAVPATPDSELIEP